MAAWGAATGETCPRGGHPAGRELTISPRRVGAGEPSTRRGSRYLPGRAAGAEYPSCKAAPSAGTAIAGASGQHNPQPPSPSHSSAWLRPAGGKQAASAGFPSRSAPPLGERGEQRHAPALPCPTPGRRQPALCAASAIGGRAACPQPRVGVSAPARGVAQPRRLLPRCGSPSPFPAAGVVFLPALSATTVVLREGGTGRVRLPGPGIWGKDPTRPRGTWSSRSPFPARQRGSREPLTSAPVHLLGGRPGRGGCCFRDRMRERVSSGLFLKTSCRLSRPSSFELLGSGQSGSQLPQPIYPKHQPHLVASPSSLPGRETGWWGLPYSLICGKKSQYPRAVSLPHHYCFEASSLPPWWEFLSTETSALAGDSPEPKSTSAGQDCSLGWNQNNPPSVVFFYILK